MKTALLISRSQNALRKKEVSLYHYLIYADGDTGV